MTSGRFITLEGGEGVGKSTQTTRLAQSLRKRGHEVLTTREPGGTPEAERIRTLILNENEIEWDPVAEALLHFAARREHVEKKIKPALDAGNWVISDRFTDSTIAYQGYGARGSIEVIRAVESAALGIFRPNLTLILDLDAAVGLERARTRSPDGDRYEKQLLAFHQRLRNGFLEIAKQAPKRCVVIEASRDEETTAAAVLAAVDDRLLDARQ